MLATPETEAELITTVALLEAYGVSCHVRGGGIGSLLPGPQIYGYNTRAIMVAAESLTLARELIASQAEVDEDSEEPVVEQTQNEKGRLRVLIEFLLFGWFIPSKQRGKVNE